MSLSGQNSEFGYPKAGTYPNLENHPTKTLERKPNRTLERKPTKTLERKPSLTIERENKLNISHNSSINDKKLNISHVSNITDKNPAISVNPPQEDKKVLFAESRIGVQRPPPLLLSEVKELREEQVISPKKHKILNDLMMSKGQTDEVYELRAQPESPMKKNQEEAGIFSNFFTNIFSNKESDKKKQIPTLTKEQIQQSTILREIYTEDLPKASQMKGKLTSSRLLTNLNDIMAPDENKNTQTNEELQHFLTSRNKSDKLQDSSNYVNKQPFTQSIYIPPTQLPSEFYRPQLTSSFNPLLMSNMNYQPLVKGTNMSNDEVKKYLQSLDSYLQKKSIAPRVSIDNYLYPRTSAIHYDNYSLQKTRSYRNNDGLLDKSPGIEHKKSSINNYSDEPVMGLIVDNEELKELKDKYYQSNALTRSVNLFKKSKILEFSGINQDEIKIGDILCSNCEEFMNPESLNAHSKVCTIRFEDTDLKRVNQKIEKMKYLLIINFKNIEPAKRQSYIELEELMNIGTIIIDEIIENNKNVKRLRKKLRDLKILLKNLPTLGNKSSNVFKVLCERILHLTLIKIDVVIRTNPEDIEPLVIDIPKKKQKQKSYISRKKIIKNEGFCGVCCGSCCGGCCKGNCCGELCCGNEHEEYEQISIDENFKVTAINHH